MEGRSGLGGGGVTKRAESGLGEGGVCDGDERGWIEEYQGTDFPC